MKAKSIETIITFDNGEQFREGDKVILKVKYGKEFIGEIIEIKKINGMFYIGVSDGNDYISATTLNLEYIKHLSENTKEPANLKYNIKISDIDFGILTLFIKDDNVKDILIIGKGVWIDKLYRADLTINKETIDNFTNQIVKAAKEEWNFEKDIALIFIENLEISMIHSSMMLDDYPLIRIIKNKY